MVQYIAPGVINPYRSGVSGGSIPGDAATGHLKRLIADYVDELEPWDTPLYTAIVSGARKRTINQLKVETGIKRTRPMFVALTGAYSTTDALITVGSTNAALLQRGMVFRIENERFWATADPNVTAGTIAVAYAQAGTSNAAHASGTRVEIIGTATTLDGPSYYNSPTIYGDFAYNHPQRFQGQITIDEMAKETPDWEYEGDKLLEMISNEAKYQKIMCHKAIIHGLRQEGTLASGATRPSLMGGIPQFLTTNVRTITGNAPLSVYDVETISSAVWASYRRMARKMVMSLNTKLAWNRLINPYRQGTLTDTKLRLKLDSVELETGEFDTMVDPYMPDGEIWGLDFSGFEWCTYKNHDWQTRDTKNPTTMADARAVVGSFSMLMPKEPLMWRITGFSTNLLDYPVGKL